MAEESLEGGLGRAQPKERSNGIELLGEHEAPALAWRPGADLSHGVRSKATVSAQVGRSLQKLLGI